MDAPGPDLNELMQGGIFSVDWCFLGLWYVVEGRGAVPFSSLSMQTMHAFLHACDHVHESGEEHRYCMRRAEKPKATRLSF